ncbi:MAG: hypothetical protein MJ086_03190 [Lachnospiraceae bacterium]|nr:hypothetical protein [Lachnospiraceae bacterium]
MKAKVIYTLMLLGVLIMLIGCGAKNELPENNFYSVAERNFSIETKYANLEYPDKWKDVVKTEIVEGNPYTVKYYRTTEKGDILLFELTFGGGDGYKLGSMNVDGQEVDVFVKDYEIDQQAMSEAEYLDCCAMEEDVNVIISKLIENNGFVLVGDEQNTEPEDTSIYGIETKYGVLSYPAKWKDIAIVKVVNDDPYVVKFAGQTADEEVPLFDLTFNGGDGYLLGTMNVDGEDVEIRINDYTFDQENLSEEDYYTCCAMQEDVNVILQYLVEDYGFEYAK